MDAGCRGWRHPFPHLLSSRYPDLVEVVAGLEDLQRGKLAGAPRNHPGRELRVDPPLPRVTKLALFVVGRMYHGENKPMGRRTPEKTKRGAGRRKDIGRKDWRTGGGTEKKKKDGEEVAS